MRFWMILVLFVGCGDKDDGGFGGAGTPTTMDPNAPVGGGSESGGTTGSGDTGSPDTGSGDTGSPAGTDDGGGGDATGGEESGGEDGGGGIAALSVTDFTVSECLGSETDTRMELTHDAIAEHLRVKHFSHGGNCCADFSLTATASSAGEVTVVYDEGSTPCDCDCSFDLVYNIAGLPSGEWVIRIPDGLQQTVTIP